LKNLKAPTERVEVSDPGKRGLRLRVSPGGTKTFVWMYKGRDKKTGKIKVCRHTFGTYPEISLAKARNMLDKKKARHKDGGLGKPEDKPKQTKDKPELAAPTDPKTVAELADLFFQHHIKPKRRRPESVKQILEADVKPVIGHRKLATLETLDLNPVIFNILNRGAQGQAEKTLRVVKQMFRFGHGLGYMDHNPAASLNRDLFGIVMVARKRKLTPDQMKTVWHGLEDTRLSPAIRIGLKILLATGVRSGELRLAKWQDVDLEKAEWRIPGENRKVHRKAKHADDWIVPLSPLAVSLFKDLKKEGDGSDWVMFSRHGGPLPAKAMPKAVQRLCERVFTDMDPWTPHDLRRSLRTQLSALEVKPHIAEIVLSHSLGQLVETYDQHDYIDEHREALERWADRLERIVATSSDNIV
jgi:integrase